MTQNRLQAVADAIAQVPDFPKPGILFKDITPILLKPALFEVCIEEMAQKVKDLKIDLIAGIEARGFIFGVPLAQKLNLPFIPIRKAGKLPRKTATVSYDLEYGTDRIQIHAQDVQAGQHVLIVDDLLATGGTANAAKQLIEGQNAIVSGLIFVIELKDLNGRAKINHPEIHAIFSD
jgi:adenine phosphoribosyltransferase